MPLCTPHLKTDWIDQMLLIGRYDGDNEGKDDGFLVFPSVIITYSKILFPTEELNGCSMTAFIILHITAFWQTDQKAAHNMANG